MTDSFIVLSLLGILIALVFSALFIKSFIVRMVEPKLNLAEIQDFTVANDSIYIDHKQISKKEFEKSNEIRVKKNIYETSILLDSYFKLITYSKQKKQFELHWVRKSKYIQPNFLFDVIVGKSVKDNLGTKYFAENNPEKLMEVQVEYETKKVVIKDKCPACGAQITDEDITCKNCEINLSL